MDCLLGSLFSSCPISFLSCMINGMMLSTCRLEEFIV